MAILTVLSLLLAVSTARAETKAKRTALAAHSIALNMEFLEVWCSKLNFFPTYTAVEQVPSASLHSRRFSPSIFSPFCPFIWV